MIERPVFASDYAGMGMQKAISFLNLVEILVVGQFRSKGVSLQEIRRAYVLLREDLKTNHPFSHKNLYAHSGKVFARVAEENNSTTLYAVVQRQEFSEEVMRGHLQPIDYNRASLQAERWHIAQGVIIDPCISFGSPVVEGKGTTTLVLAKEYWANDENAGLVANLYDVRPDDVQNAVDFESRFGRRRAA